jgi:glutamyl-tRNA reductase
VAIIGGGYMAEAFFTALLRARFDNVRKILWINRSVPKLRRSLAAIIDLLDVPIELLDLVEGNSALVEANAVFCALAASPDRYADVRCRRGTFIVDVSYPPVFTPNPEISLVNIANTYFDHLVRTPVPKTFVAEAESEIDRIIAFLRVSS